MDCLNDRTFLTFYLGIDEEKKEGKEGEEEEEAKKNTRETSREQGKTSRLRMIQNDLGRFFSTYSSSLFWRCSVISQKERPCSLIAIRSSMNYFSFLISKSDVIYDVIIRKNRRCPGVEYYSSKRFFVFTLMSLRRICSLIVSKCQEKSIRAARSIVWLGAKNLSEYHSWLEKGKRYRERTDLVLVLQLLNLDRRSAKNQIYWPTSPKKRRTNFVLDEFLLVFVFFQQVIECLTIFLFSSH